MSTTLEGIGAAIRLARESAGLTQEELAQQIGVSRYWLLRAERGAGRMELDLVLRACRVLGIDVRFVLPNGVVA
jgi:transcriptional regulator with XRE-family HTH domain